MLNQVEKILILGFGREGQATLRYLKGNYPQIIVGVADLRPLVDFNNEEKELINLITESHRYLGENYLASLKDYPLIIKSPGINPRLKEIAEAKRFGVEISSATNIFFEQKKGRVIAVTGSKGKSTTASMIYQVLKAAGKDVELIGNIGKAAVDFLTADSTDKIYVFEMSSYQLEDFKSSADIAVLVSFFPEHLDYHGSLEAYFNAKIQLIANPKPGLKVIYNWSNEKLRAYFSEYQRAMVNDVEVIAFNDFQHSKIEEINNQFWALIDEQKILNESQLKLKGKHNLENVLAVLEIAKLFDINNKLVVEVLESFNPLEHRLEKVGEFKGITFYNDAISTTPESTIAALEALQRHGDVETLIVGGLDRGYNFSGLAEKILALKVKILILLPETGEKIKNELEKWQKKIGGDLPLFINSEKMEYCVEMAYKMTTPGHICLLSCASPSYNLFKNFEERGKRFKNAVLDLAK